MGRFDRQIETAKRLIELNGQKVTWRRIFDDDINAAEPWKSEDAGAPVEVPNISICFLPINQINNQLIRALTGTDEATTGSVYGLMGAVSFDPSRKDVVIRDGIEYAIKSIDTLSPNGQKILYTIQFVA